MAGVWRISASGSARAHALFVGVIPPFFLYGVRNAHRVAFLQAGYGVTLVGRAMGSELDIRPLRKAPAFGAGIGWCIAIEIVAHKKGPHGENKSTTQLAISDLKKPSRCTAFASTSALKVSLSNL